MVVLSEEDKLVLARFLDLEELCIKKKTPQFSQFLDPKEAMLFTKVYKPSAFVNVRLFGGYSESERCVAGFFPDFLEAEAEEFPISVLEITGAKDSAHRDFMGSILGLGIKRAAIGDIVLTKSVCYVFVLETMRDFILLNLSRIGRQKVSVKELKLGEADIPQKEFNEIFASVASLRLDAVVSTAAHLSRSKAVALIEKELVFVNWQPSVNPSRNVETGDVISVRGFGRIRIGEILGETKKGRLKIQLKTDK